MIRCSDRIYKLEAGSVTTGWQQNTVPLRISYDKTIPSTSKYLGFASHETKLGTQVTNSYNLPVTQMLIHKAMMH
jgi:hypothetical protein